MVPGVKKKEILPDPPRVRGNKIRETFLRQNHGSLFVDYRWSLVLGMFSNVHPKNWGKIGSPILTCAYVS